MTEKSPTTLSPLQKKPAGQEVRRRFYTGCVVGLAVFFIGLGAWPFGAESFRTSCKLDVRLNPDFVRQNPTSHGTIEVSLREEISKTLESASLAACIRRCSISESDSIASMRVPELRSALDVRIIRPADPKATWRRIQIALVGKGDAFEREVVNEILHSLAGRLSRKADWNILDQQMGGQRDLIAMNHQQFQSEVGALIQKTKDQYRHYQNQLDGLSDKLARYNGQENHARLSELETQLNEVRRQVVESDLHLVKEIKTRFVGQYEPKDNDPLNNHLDRLIQDRTNMLVSWKSTIPAQKFGVNGAMRSNPFFSQAAYKKDINRASEGQLDEIRGQFQSFNLVAAQGLLKDLETAVHRLKAKPVSFSVAKAAEKQESKFSITDISPSTMAFPNNGYPAESWIYSLGFLCIGIGSVFTLTWQPGALSSQLSTPKQLATYLGLQHLGSIKSEALKVGVADKAYRYMGIGIFRACEFVMLGVLCCMIVAMVWDNQLPGLLFSNPLEFFFRAVWVLFGR